MSESSNPVSSSTEPRNFIQQIIDEDLKHDRTNGRVHTRFPPEPNGFLHIGHAKAIVLNFGIAAQYGGLCNLRFDDTNPETEDMKYVQAIKEDIRWLGFDWDNREYYASDYFEKLYDHALQLIKDGKAYVDSSSEEEIRTCRGTVTEPGKNSPYRDRSPEENADLFKRMRAGEFEPGSHVLRAKIDMSSDNMLMRDPLLYRIRSASHYRRGTEFPIYPMYDFAHPLSDAIEGITHSLCTLEFDVHRPVYDWLVDALYENPRPHQYEFARFNLDFTIMSKRKLLRLVNDRVVSGWDDPRMPTLAGFRRRGVTPEAIRTFAEMIGVAKAHNRVDISILEYAIRDDLNDKAPRVMCVLNPVKVVLTNFEEEVEWIEADYWPHDIPREGTRPVPLTRELFIDRDDFQEEPEKGFFRLSPGEEVRLRYAYVIRCNEVIKDGDGNIIELRCTYDPETKSGSSTSGRKVKGTVHWVSASQSRPVTARLYDRLFSVPDPEDVPEGGTFMDNLNPESLELITGARMEISLENAKPGDRFQFERVGYFVFDESSTEDKPVVNRTISLRDTWGKNTSRQKEPATSDRKSSKPVASAPSAPPLAPRDPLSELGATARNRADGYIQRMAISDSDAALIAGDAAWAEFFESTVAASAEPDLAPGIANWIVQDLRPELEDGPAQNPNLKPAHLAELVALQKSNTVSSTIATELLELMLESGKSPEALVDEKGLRQVSDETTLRPIVESVLAEFPERVAAYRNGKTGLIGFFLGQVMRQTDGKANPVLVRKLLENELG